MLSCPGRAVLLRQLVCCALGIAALALPYAASPTPAAGSPSARLRPPGSGVVGGHDAAAGKWPEVAAIYVGTIPYCTGVLVAPTVVLTAAHCNTTGLAEVVIGADTLADGNGGERIRVTRRIEYPDWDLSFDVLALVLEHPSTRPPRPLATGWAGIEIADGHEVTIVGFGAVDNEGKQFVLPLQEATTVITDALCTRASGCNLEARPAGELGAGGMGIDSCSGDSGGPLYVTGELGTFVAGLTSRSYDDATLPCSQGGIYTRADRIADWIERETGVTIARGREPELDPLDLSVGAGDQTRISANDPRSTRHRFAIAAGPRRGSATIDSSGNLRMCATGKGAATDRIVVEITDANDPSRQIYTTVPVTIRDGVDDGGCELDEGGCGCQGGGPGSGAGAALLLALTWSFSRLSSARRGHRETSKPPLGSCV